MKTTCVNDARLPKLRQSVETNADDHFGSTEPMPISFILASKRKPKPPIFAATKWIQVRNPLSREQEYIKQIQSDVEVVDTIDEIDVDPYVLTTYQVNDYVLRSRKLVGEIHTNTAHGGVAHIKSLMYFNIVMRISWLLYTQLCDELRIRRWCHAHPSLLFRSDIRHSAKHRGQRCRRDGSRYDCTTWLLGSSG